VHRRVGAGKPQGEISERIVRRCEQRLWNTERQRHAKRIAVTRSILDGDVTLELDDEKVLLHPGDCVVQRNTNHAWRNHGTAPIRLLAVMVALDRGATAPDR